jgi:hypothetical protein
VSASALDLGELGYELATVDLAGDGLTLRVKAQPARALAVGRNTVIRNEMSHGSASIVAPVARQLPFVQILNVGLDLYSLTFWVSTYPLLSLCNLFGVEICRLFGALGLPSPTSRLASLAARQECIK